MQFGVLRNLPYNTGLSYVMDLIRYCCLHNKTKFTILNVNYNRILFCQKSFMNQASKCKFVIIWIVRNQYQKKIFIYYLFSYFILFLYMRWSTVLFVVPCRFNNAICIEGLKDLNFRKVCFTLNQVICDRFIIKWKYIRTCKKKIDHAC